MKVQVTFNLEEDVTPEIFTQKLSDLVHRHYLIRDTESVTWHDITFVVPEGYDEPLQWPPKVNI